MNKIYNALDYFKGALLSGYSTLEEESIGFISESFEKAIGGRNFSVTPNSLISVSTIAGNALRLAFDVNLGCSRTVCNCMKTDIARKFGIHQNYIYTLPRRISRPYFLVGGEPIAHKFLNGYGTLGGFLIDKNNERAHCMVSNNHVLANSNNANLGDDIYYKGSSPARHIGKLLHFLPIRFNGIKNNLDIAVAAIDHDEQLQIGAYCAMQNPLVGEGVHKFGATTGKRFGTILSTDETVRVKYGNNFAVFEDQILIISNTEGESFSQPGDSGSFIFDSNNNFVGLLFAGNGTDTHANHGKAVASQLRNWKLLS